MSRLAVLPMINRSQAASPLVPTSTRSWSSWRTARTIATRDHLYEEVRSYAAPITLHREACSIDRVWRETWANLGAARANKSLNLKEELSTDDFKCLVDPIALEQIFRNIFENAIYVSQPGNAVLIRARQTNFAGRDSLEIHTCDDGPGLDATQASRILEPFFTTKTQGTGLGMAIVKRIVEAHGGHIRVEQRNCPGAEIILILPRREDS